jgi:hypothetical protein
MHEGRKLDMVGDEGNFFYRSKSGLLFTLSSGDKLNIRSVLLKLNLYSQVLSELLRQENRKV